MLLLVCVQCKENEEISCFLFICLNSLLATKSINPCHNTGITIPKRNFSDPWISEIHLSSQLIASSKKHLLEPSAQNVSSATATGPATVDKKQWPHDCGEVVKLTSENKKSYISRGFFHMYVPCLSNYYHANDTFDLFLDLFLSQARTQFYPVNFYYGFNIWLSYMATSQLRPSGSPTSLTLSVALRPIIGTNAK